MGGKYIKIGMKSLAAMLTAFLLVNGLCFAYFYMPMILSRSENATWLIFRPDSHTRQMTEGSGVVNIDGNGYLNPDMPLKESGYVLTLGTSHTAGEEVADSERYTSLLNEMLGGGSALNVYNMGMDGHEYPAMVRGFRAATEEFPNSSAVIIEIPQTIYRIDELNYALNQREFDESRTSAALFGALTPRQKAELKIKENLPFPAFLKSKQFPGGVRPDFSSAFGLKNPPRLSGLTHRRWTPKRISGQSAKQWR